MSDSKPKPLTPGQKAIFDALPVVPSVSDFFKNGIQASGPQECGVGAPHDFDYEAFRQTGLLNGRAVYRPLTYLACPYTCKTAKLRRERFLLATQACKHLMVTEGLNVFSPITHSHPLYEIGMRGDWDFWKKIDTEYLRLSAKVVVLMLAGWLESKGVTAEIKLAKEMGIPVEYLDPKTINNE